MDKWDDFPFTKTGVYVTVADHKSVGITDDNKIVYLPTNNAMMSDVAYMGQATVHNINTIIAALERLKIHALE